MGLSAGSSNSFFARIQRSFTRRTRHDFRHGLDVQTIPRMAWSTCATCCLVALRARCHEKATTGEAVLRFGRRLDRLVIESSRRVQCASPRSIQSRPAPFNVAVARSATITPPLPFTGEGRAAPLFLLPQAERIALG